MRIISFMLVFAFMAIHAFGKGKIAGKVSDEQTGYAVINAVVVVKGTANGTITDIDGRYDLEVDAGTYSIEVKYPGYDSKIIEGIVVTENAVVETNVSMAMSDKNNLDEVVVKTTRNRETVAALYIDQRNNTSLSSGISADIIKRSPDRSTGEVLKRVSGASVQDNKYVVIRGLSDRYNLAMVNNALMPSTEPDRKAFSFDIIPSNLIDNMIISKTATPDLPGDFAGGVVQVLTKDVPDQDFLNIGIGMGYNTQTTFKDFKSNDRPGGAGIAFPNSDYDLPSSFGGNYKDYTGMGRDKQVAAAKELPNNYTVNTNSALPNTSIQASYGKSVKLKNGGKFGAILGLTYGNSRNTSADFIRGNYTVDQVNFTSKETQYQYSTSVAALANFAYVKGKSKITFKNLYNRLYDATYYERSGYSNSSSQEFLLYSTVPSSRQIYNSQLQGKHAFGNDALIVDWNLNYSNLNADQTDLRTAYYGRAANLDGNAQPIEEPAGALGLIDRNSRRFFSSQQDNNFGGSFNITKPFEINDVKQTLKIGYLGLFKNRMFDARVLQYERDNFAPAGIQNLPIGEIFATSNIASNRYTIDDNTNNTDNYEANALLNAGYFMLDNAFAKKWRAIWGVRVESYSQNIQTYDRTNTYIDKTDVFTDILPSLNVTYDLNKTTKVRLAVSRTVNRPEFREIATFAFTDFENQWSVVGNPDLVRANVTNIDLRYEIYPTPGEAITFGAFYKDFKNPIEIKMDDQSNLDFFIFTYQNAASASAAGFEFDIRKKMNFLGSQDWLDRLILSANFTYIYSRVDASNIIGSGISTPGTKAERPLQGQSPYIANLSLLYNTNNGWAFSALYNRIGQRIAIVGNASIPTTWENGRNVVDIQVSKTVFKGRGELKLTISDLLNSPYTLYWNQIGTKDSYQNGDNAVSTEDDLIFRQYRLGTGVNVGFTYNLFK